MVSHAVGRRHVRRGNVKPYFVSSKKPRPVKMIDDEGPSVRSNRIFLLSLYAVLAAGILLFLAFIYALFAEIG